MAEKVRRRLRRATVLVSMSMFAFSATGQDAVPLDWRGVLIGADHTPPSSHHDNLYVQKNGGPLVYCTTIPARQTNSMIADAGLLFHLFTRDAVAYTVHATSSFVDGRESGLSEGLAIRGEYPANSGCTEQTVPVADPGQEQVVAVGAAVTLDATASYDPYVPDTSQLLFDWQSFSAPETVALESDGESPVTGFTPMTMGDYYLRLTVRDHLEGTAFNRSPVAYVRVSAVLDPDDPTLLHASAGRPQQVMAGQPVTLDGSRSIGPVGTNYRWEHTNPIGTRELQGVAEAFGSADCTGTCYRANFDANAVVDGRDVALLANNWGSVAITNSDQAVAEFTATIARPHIFRLTLSDGLRSAEETSIVAVHHPNVAEVVTPPSFDPLCSL